MERIEYFNSFKNEIEENFANEIQQVINSTLSQIFNTLFCIHYVLTSITHKDVIIYGYISLLLGDYAERTGNNATGVVVLKDTLDFIEKAKEKKIYLELIIEKTNKLIHRLLAIITRYIN